MDKAQLTDRITAIRNTMATSGWRYLEQDWKEDKSALEQQAAYGTKNFEEVATIRGALNVLHRLLNLSLAVDQVEASISEDGDGSDTAEG